MSRWDEIHGSGDESCGKVGKLDHFGGRIF